MADVLRVIPLGGLGEVGKNMTVYEIGDDRIVVDAGMSFPRDEHLGVDLILPDFGYLHDKRDPRRRAHARARGSRRRAAVPDARGARRGDLGDAADPRPRQVEARRARAAARRRAARGRSGGRCDRPRAVPARVHPHGALRSRLRRHRDRDERRPRLPHGRLEARPHAGRRPAHRRRPARRARQPRRRPAARRLDERGAARLHALRARRRRGVPPDHPAAPAAACSSPASRRTSTACSRRSTSRPTPAARSSSSAARCAAT